MKPPHLAIIGTTSVGKSDCAFALAEEIGKQYSQVFIISVDSRQVYKGLEILSGCDIPSGYTRVHNDAISPFDFFTYKNISLFGLSCIEVWEEWSVAHFKTFALKLYQYAAAKGIPVIFVGGTGLYYEHLFSEDPALAVPPNDMLRAQLAEATSSQLLALLTKQNPLYASQMNDSDAHNKRRLIRALERSAAGALTLPKPTAPEVPLTFIGLRSSVGDLQERIEKRVRMRYVKGAIEEVSGVAQQSPTHQVRTTLGFLQCENIALGKPQEGQVLDWITSEIQYARRQQTWWKKHQHITWFDRSDSGWFLLVKKHLGI